MIVRSINPVIVTRRAEVFGGFAASYHNCVCETYARVPYALDTLSLVIGQIRACVSPCSCMAYSIR